MKSRYSAYATSNIKYIINTTHKNHPDYLTDTLKWEKELFSFCQDCTFDKLEVLEFIDGDHEAFVTFKASIFCKNDDNSFCEKSRFLKENSKWYYESGSFLNIK